MLGTLQHSAFSHFDAHRKSSDSAIVTAGYAAVMAETADGGPPNSIAVLFAVIAIVLNAPDIRASNTTAFGCAASAFVWPPAHENNDGRSDILRYNVGTGIICAC